MMENINPKTTTIQFQIAFSRVVHLFPVVVAGVFFFPFVPFIYRCGAIKSPSIINIVRGGFNDDIILWRWWCWAAAGEVNRGGDVGILP